MVFMVSAKFVAFVQFIGLGGGICVKKGSEKTLCGVHFAEYKREDEERLRVSDVFPFFAVVECNEVQILRYFT